MDNGIWALGFVLIPLVCFVLALGLIVYMVCRKKKSIITIALIVLLLYPVAILIFNTIARENEKVSYANINDLDYQIEQIDENTYNVYFYDDEGYYYTSNKSVYFEKDVVSLYLEKQSKNREVGKQINLLDSYLTKIYMIDYKDNCVLVWDVNDYLKKGNIQSLEIEKVDNKIYITEESLKNITIDYNERFFDYSWVIKRNDEQILGRAMSPYNLYLDFSDLKEEYYQPSGNYEVYLEIYDDSIGEYVKASNSINWIKE